MRETTRRWLRLADSDLNGARTLLEGSEPALVLIHCQQAVEKMLKAVWSEDFDEEPPRTHDLGHLAEGIGIRESGVRELLTRLEGMAAGARYLDPDAYTHEQASDFFQRTRQLCAELRQRLS